MLHVQPTSPKIQDGHLDLDRDLSADYGDPVRLRPAIADIPGIHPDLNPDLGFGSPDGMGGGSLSTENFS